MESSLFNLTHPSNLMLSITTGTISAIGIPGNLCLMLMILSEYKTKKPHEWLLFMLAMGDFFLCLHSAVFETIFIIKFDGVACKAVGAIDYFLGLVSVHTPPVIAYNRYLSLYNTQKCARIFTNRNVFFVWTLILVMAFFWVSPFIFTGSLGQDDVGLCGLQIRGLLQGIAFAGIAFSCMLLCTVLVYFSFKVIVKIRRHKKEATAQSQIQSRLINESKDIITAVLIISTIPLFAQIPSIIVKLLQIFLPPFNPWVGRSLVATFPLTAAANAYVTMYVVKEYRSKVVRVFKRLSARVGEGTRMSGHR